MAICEIQKPTQDKKHLVKEDNHYRDVENKKMYNMRGEYNIVQ
jgi:hypothetical protein